MKFLDLVEYRTALIMFKVRNKSLPGNILEMWCTEMHSVHPYSCKSGRDDKHFSPQQQKTGRPNDATPGDH